MTSYCEYCISHPEDTFNKTYHDTQYGFPLRDDNLLFERLILEINQAGLSWITILKKAENFHQAYHGFEIARVAKYGEKDFARLMADPGIIRNRLKINAAIVNAQRIVELQKECGSLAAWLDRHHPLSKEEWTRLFKRTFVFTGGEIVSEFLMSTGYLAGAHEEGCPVYRRVASLRPAWMRR
jgi:DNA-3-methyladenine glycosylase I